MNNRGLNRMLLQLGLVMLAVLIAVPSFAADVYLVAREFTKTMPDGTSVPMWGFATDADSDLSTSGTEVPTAPGPVITVAPGDGALNIHLRNDLAVPISIVMPGQTQVLNPVRFVDSLGRSRVQSFTHQTAPGATGVYSWNALEPGTYIYHSGTHPSVQVPMGLYGGVKKDAAAGSAYGPGTNSDYDAEVVLFYSEVDPALNGAVAGGVYGTPAYPGTINYSARYFLVNGEPYHAGSAALPAGNVNDRVLVRLLNAGLEEHVAAFNSVSVSAVAEDGSPYPYPRVLNSVPLPAGKTTDAIIVPGAEGAIAVYDRRLHLNSGDVPGSGMLAYLDVASAAGAPVAADDAYSTDEDTALVVAAPGVLGNDTDPEGDPLSAMLVTSTSGGALVFNPDGSFSYTPDADFNGNDVLEYRASDGALESAVALATIAVNPVNDAPVAADDAAVAEEGIAVVVDVLANDSDVDGDALTVGGVTQGVSGSVAINGDNTVTYTPDTGFVGDDSFTYTSMDGTMESAPATVSVTVNAHVNKAPVANDDYATTPKNEVVIINLVANDTDSDGTIDPATVVIVTEPTRRGTVVNNGNGTVTYTPRRNFRGTDVFTYTVNDNDGATSNEATIRVNVVK